MYRQYYLIGNVVILGNIGEKFDKDYHGMPDPKADSRPSRARLASIHFSPHSVVGKCIAPTQCCIALSSK